LPFEQVRYETADAEAEQHLDSSATWHDVFDLNPEWPGPDDPFEGINTDTAMPPPRFWSPTVTDGDTT
jgi:hypothetical protein